MGAIAGLVLGILWMAGAAAHGGGTPQLTAAPAGPYHLFAWTTPEPWRVGAAHTTVAVTQPDAAGRDTPISGAAVTVLYAPADGAEPALRVTAVEGSGAQAGFYEADADLPAAGEWQVTILVTGPAGSGEAGFVNSVLPAESGVNWWFIALGIGGLALLATAWWATKRPERGRTATGSRQPAGSP